MSFPELPLSLRKIEHLLNTAKQYEKRDVVVYYWCLFRAAQCAMNLDRSSKQAIAFLHYLLSLLENIKKQNSDNEALSQEITAQAHIEDRAQRLLSYANSQDYLGVFNSSVVKTFYTSSCLMDVLEIWSNDENIQSARKYAKWRATYINNCLKDGEVPTRNGSKAPPQAPVLLQSSAYASTSFVPVNPVPSSPPVNRESKPVLPITLSPSLEMDKRVKLLTAQPSSSDLSIDNVEKSSASSSSLVPFLPVDREPFPDLTLDDFVEARKFIKYALSALDYDDARASVENLLKAIAVLQKR